MFRRTAWVNDGMPWIWLVSVWEGLGNLAAENAGDFAEVGFF